MDKERMEHIIERAYKKELENFCAINDIDKLEKRLAVLYAFTKLMHDLDMIDSEKHIEMDFIAFDIYKKRESKLRDK